MDHGPRMPCLYTNQLPVSGMSAMASQANDRPRHPASKVAGGFALGREGGRNGSDRLRQREGMHLAGVPLRDGRRKVTKHLAMSKNMHTFDPSIDASIARFIAFGRVVTAADQHGRPDTACICDPVFDCPDHPDGFSPSMAERRPNEQFHRRSAAPEALKYGAKNAVGSSAEKQRACRTVQVLRVRESDRQGPTVRLLGNNGVTHGSMGTGSVRLEKPVYHTRCDIDGSHRRGGRGMRAELPPMCQRGGMETFEGGPKPTHQRGRTERVHT